mgnify:CR=1 FL=1
MADDGNYGTGDIGLSQSMQHDATDMYGMTQTALQQFPPEFLQIYLRNQGIGHPGINHNEFQARGTWTQQEDEQLTNAVLQLGTKKWTDIAKFVPTRTSKQCRERWFHRLDPSIRREPFEPWEDQIIIEKQKEIGNRWAIIAQQIPGRSPSAVKNRWYSGLKNHHATHVQVDLNAMALMEQMTHDDSLVQNTDL